jgi:transposase-like protein
VDETYIPIKGEWKYLYRAVDSQGNTLDFMLSALARWQSGSTVLSQGFESKPCHATRRDHVDKNAAYPVAIERLKNEQTLAVETELRQVKYSNNPIEQDHRHIKRIVKPMLGFKSFHSARRTLSGIEAMSMIGKGQVQGVERGDVRSQVEFVSQVFGLVA